jgi:preprotein translocase subunit SecD
VRVAWLVLVALLALAGCTSRTGGAPAKDDSPVVGSTNLVVPIELRPVVEQGTSPSAAPSASASASPSASASASPSASASAPPSQTQLPDPSGEQLTLAEPVMTIEHLDRAEILFDQPNSTWALSIDLTDEDTAAFADWTADHVNERLAMVVDDEVLIAPTIQSAITDGVVQITGNYTQDEVKELLDKITGR